MQRTEDRYLKSHSLRMWTDRTSGDFLPLDCELGHLVLKVSEHVKPGLPSVPRMLPLLFIYELNSHFDHFIPTSWRRK